MIILIILIIVLLLSFFFINKTLKKKDNILEDVKLQENTIKNNGFALMLEQDDGTYKESTSSSWPTDMVFNSELSGCIDTDGNKIEDSLSFDKENNIVNVSVGETAYCYVYFDIKKYCENNETLSNCIVRNSNNGVEEIWKSTLEDDGYRFVGTNPNNYICFGTTDKNTCINDTDKYMYRIIGIFEDESGNKHAKLIKKEALNTAYAWDAAGRNDIDWNKSDLYDGLNGSYFLTNTSYPYMQDTNWTDKIATWNYTMTNTKTEESYKTYYNSISVKNIYLHELNRSDNTITNGTWTNLSTKISLMYISDYALSLGETALNYTSDSNSRTLKTGWMHISNNDSRTLSKAEWTMSRYGFFSDVDSYDSWNVNSDGTIYRSVTSAILITRPVFYLESNVEYFGGFGTSKDPFIIT